MEKRRKEIKEITFLNAFRQKQNVMKAVILRDMRSRFFNHGLGFLVQSLWPLAHILIIIAINTVAGRAAPYGDSPFIFLGPALFRH